MIEKSLSKASRWQDAHGSRRWPRHVFHTRPTVRLDNASAALLDLSIGGAQVVVPTSPAPGESLHLFLRDAHVTLRLPSAVVWSKPQELLNPDSKYVVGLRFVEPDAYSTQVRDFCLRHP